MSIAQAEIFTQSAERVSGLIPLPVSVFCFQRQGVREITMVPVADVIDRFPCACAVESWFGALQVHDRTGSEHSVTDTIS